MPATTSGFFEAVYEVVRSVPRGRVVTYGQIARLLGQPRGARAVGWALRALHGPRSRRVPWHRVLGHGGRLSMGVSPSGLEQRRRLAAEGVRLVGQRVDFARHAFIGPQGAGVRAAASQSRSGKPSSSRARRHS